MESVDLFDANKMNENNKNQTIKTNIIKSLRYKKCLDIKLIILISIFISNVYLIYLFKSIINFNGVFPKSFFSKSSKSIDSANANKAKSIIKESLAIQKDFCNNPNKYLNQEYENMIKLTDFMFKNISYKIGIYLQKR